MRVIVKMGAAELVQRLGCGVQCACSVFRHVMHACADVGVVCSVCVCSQCPRACSGGVAGAGGMDVQSVQAGR